MNIFFFFYQLLIDFITYKKPQYFTDAPLWSEEDRFVNYETDTTSSGKNQVDLWGDANDKGFGDEREKVDRTALSQQ